MKKIVFLMLVVLLGVGGYAQEGEYVDLGLPSGTKWKTVNEQGYFKYDDAVEKYGKGLPSKEQWEELKKKCEWEWVTGESLNETGCYVIGPNGKRIFLPATGYRYGKSARKYNTYGGYWSSTYSGGNYACNMMFFSDKDLRVVRGGNDRNFGLSVRLVQD